MKVIEYVETIEKRRRLDVPDYFFEDKTNVGQAVDYLLQKFSDWNPRDKLNSKKASLEPLKAYNMLSAAYEQVDQIAALLGVKLEPREGEVAETKVAAQEAETKLAAQEAIAADDGKTEDK